MSISSFLSVADEVAIRLICLGNENKYSRGKSSNDVKKVPRLVEISSFLMQYQYWENYLRPALQFFSHFLNSRKRGDNE